MSRFEFLHLPRPCTYSSTNPVPESHGLVSQARRISKNLIQLLLGRCGGCRLIWLMVRGGCPWLCSCWLVVVGYLPTHWLAHADEYYYSVVGGDILCISGRLQCLQKLIEDPNNSTTRLKSWWMHLEFPCVAHQTSLIVLSITINTHASALNFLRFWSGWQLLITKHLADPYMSWRRNRTLVRACPTTWIN